MSALGYAATTARFRAGDPLYARAYDLADQGHTQEQIATALAAAFPDLPDARYALTPAAAAVMHRVRREHKERERAVANSEWRRQRGLPEQAAPHHACPNPFVGPDDY
jgi:hypothetical protein